MSVYIALGVGLALGCILEAFLGRARTNKFYPTQTALEETLTECQDILSQARCLTAIHIARFNVIRVNFNLRPYKSKLRLKDLEDVK